MTRPRDHALVRNAADPEQVRQAGQKVEYAKDRRANGWRFILSNPDAQYAVWELIGQCHVFAARRQSDADQQFDAGQRNVGIYVIDQITAARPNALVEMMLEAQEAKAKQ